MFCIDTQDLAEKISRRLTFRLDNADTGRTVSDALLWTTRNHISARYPGSTHWDPSRVVKNGESDNGARISVDIPGAGRAYHDVDIYPVVARALCFPIHPSAYGKRARDYDGLFKRGNNLAKAFPSGVTDLFHLCKHVHQRRDPTLLPSDQDFVDNIMARWISSFTR